MTPREWLGRAKTAQQELRLIREAREAIYASLTSVTQNLGGDPVQSTKDPHKFDRLGDVAIEMDNAEKNLKRILREVFQAIMQVKESRYRQILILLYMRGLDMTATAKEVGYSYEHTCRLHGRAILEIAEVIKGHDGEL